MLDDIVLNRKEWSLLALYTGGSRISGMGVHMYKSVCVCGGGGGRFADYLIFHKYPMKMK